jgi:hypothetical protein
LATAVLLRSSACAAACYISALLAGNPDYSHHVIHRDDVAVVYLCKYLALWGHLIATGIVGHLEGRIEQQLGPPASPVQ